MRTYCAITLLCLYCFSGEANVVSISTAQSVALNFYKGKTNSVSSSLTAILKYAQIENDGTSDFYILNIGTKGFVIVSATDNVTPILGYSTESNFTANISQTGFSDWMQHLSTQIHQAIFQNTPATNTTTGLWSAYQSGLMPASLRSSTVSPMLPTAWGQSPNYNMLCPYDSTNQGRSVTGCEATAMAQIMKYWSYPAQGTGSYSYTDATSDGYSYNIGTLSADFSKTQYQWADMPLSLEGEDSSVARLMYQCGVSIAMNYSSRGSSAYSYYYQHPCVLSALISYFSYDAATIQYVQQANYTYDGWQSLIENELDQGRPVLCSGRDTGNIGGHAWVCDGYDASGMLHMNWGWGGMDNGYFLVTDLDPDGENWTWDQAAIIGIQPPGYSTPSSVTNIAADVSFDLYPNPAATVVTLRGNNTGSSVTYSIYDLLGNNISQSAFDGASASVDIRSWSAGIYLARLQSGQKETTLRFVIEK